MIMKQFVAEMILHKTKPLKPNFISKKSEYAYFSNPSYTVKVIKTALERSSQNSLVK